VLLLCGSKLLRVFFVESARNWNRRIRDGCERRGQRNFDTPELPLTEDDVERLATAAERPLLKESLNVFSTTTTFVVSTDFKRIITCFQTNPSYSEWLKRPKPITKSKPPKGSGGRKQEQTADTMATRHKAFKVQQREWEKSFKAKKRDTLSRLKKSYRK
jgi:hypothetical protein